MTLVLSNPFEKKQDTSLNVFPYKTKKFTKVEGINLFVSNINDEDRKTYMGNSEWCLFTVCGDLRDWTSVDLLLTNTSFL
ncbi:hypothetical protein BN1058_01193 [Paraliobacillus sp. PM-2]|uniref:hypothetical protein n=1 Tax=Paraliobacillus sp. PM-2 TaxID=1462524 RepID=UPI00061C83ED|nr:hypothetical protein [Paraliobacillus sp. PM-2]CQR46909.1 hypothetical protein BN1058_01193 [Paraliobacillus sp. PM-2]